MGPWCVDWMKALTTHYGVNKDDIIYFAAHYEADVAEHEGRAAHSSVVQTVLERMLMDGVADELSGFGLEYCAVTPVKLLGQMHQACTCPAPSAFNSHQRTHSYRVRVIPRALYFKTATLMEGVGR